jgi:hypothetical protein
MALQGPDGSRVALQVDEVDGTGHLLPWWRRNGVLDVDDEIVFQADLDPDVQGLYHLFLNIPTGAAVPFRYRSAPPSSASMIRRTDNPWYQMTVSNSALTFGVHDGRVHDAGVGYRGFGAISYLKHNTWTDDVFLMHTAYDSHYPENALSKDPHIQWGPLQVAAAGPVRTIVEIVGTVNKEYMETSDPSPILGRLHASMRRQFILYANLPYVEVREVFTPLEPGGVDPNLLFADNLAMRGGAARAWDNEEMHIPTQDKPSTVFVMTPAGQQGRAPAESYGSLPTSPGEGWFAFTRGEVPGASSSRTIVHFLDSDHFTSAKPISLFGNLATLTQSEGEGISAYIRYEARGESPLTVRRGFYLMEGKQPASRTKSIYMQFRSHSLQKTLRLLQPRKG